MTRTRTPTFFPFPTSILQPIFRDGSPSTLQDLNSTYSQPTGDPQSACDVNPDMPDLWLISNNPLATWDPTGQAAVMIP